MSVYSLSLYLLALLINVYYLQTIPSKLNEFTVPKLTQLALDLLTVGYLVLAIKTSISSLFWRNGIRRFFYTLNRVDASLKLLGSDEVFHKVFFKISVAFIGSVTIFEHAYGSFTYFLVLGKRISTTADVKMTLASGVASTGYVCYMTFFIFLVYALRLRFVEVNNIFRTQFLTNIQYEPFSQFSLVKTLGIIHIDLIEMVEIINSTYALSVAVAIALSFNLTVFVFFQIFHLTVEFENVYSVFIVLIWSGFYGFFVYASFFAAGLLAESVGLMFLILLLIQCFDFFTEFTHDNSRS